MLSVLFFFFFYENSCIFDIKKSLHDMCSVSFATTYQSLWVGLPWLQTGENYPLMERSKKERNWKSKFCFISFYSICIFGRKMQVCLHKWRVCWPACANQKLIFQILTEQVKEQASELELWIEIVCVVSTDLTCHLLN